VLPILSAWREGARRRGRLQTRDMTRVVTGQHLPYNPAAVAVSVDF
jgi:hypothetical protein